MAQRAAHAMFDVKLALASSPGFDRVAQPLVEGEVRETISVARQDRHAAFSCCSAQCDMFIGVGNTAKHALGWNEFGRNPALGGDVRWQRVPVEGRGMMQAISKKSTALARRIHRPSRH